MKEENRMMQDEMMNEEEIIGKEIEKELENTPEKNTEKNAQKEKMINLMNRYHSSTGADKAEVVQELLEEVQGFLGFAITKYFPAFKQNVMKTFIRNVLWHFWRILINMILKKQQLPIS